MKMSVFIATSLDGYIARENGDIDFLEKFPLKGEDFGFKEFTKDIDCMIIGRNTYEKALTFPEFPYKIKTFVLSTKLKSSPHKNVEIINLTPQDLFDKLLSEGFTNAYLDGGKLIQSFLRDDLVDEITITRLPILIGSGIPLFNSSSEVILELVENRSYANGFIQSVYKTD